MERECFWVNLREENKGVWIQDGSVWIHHGRIQDGCHHQVESEWMIEVFLCKWWELILASVSEIERKIYYGWIQDGGIQDGRTQDGCHHQVESEWMSEGFFLCKMAESKMAEFNYGCHHHSWVRMNEWCFFCTKWLRGIQDGCLHQDESEWMSLSQIELVGIRVFSKMAESKMAEFKMAQSNKMAAIIKFKLSQNEWLWVRLN